VLILLGVILIGSFVFAIEAGEGCCFESKEGFNCGLSVAGECSGDSDFAESVECSQTSFCKKGCCIDESRGIYDKNVWKSACSGKWVDDPNCNLPGAALGCCVLGTQTYFQTKGQCKVNSLVFAIGDKKTMDWRADVGEAACLILADVQSKGACVLNGGKCKFVTEADCMNLGGNFAKNYLCTNPDLNVSCNMTKETTCVEGKDEVYFVDSCGNIANVYDAARIEDSDYWNYIIEDEKLCGFGSENGNANSSDCGNCDRFKGGICRSASENGFGVDYGDSYCKDTSCSFGNETYKSGESWCDYDGAIGNGDDVVGSRHWRYVCSQGDVLVEPCADLRKEICVATDSYEENGTNISFMSSACVANNWGECLSLNEKGADGSKCNAARDCFIKSVNIGKFGFNICLPEYPRGFDWKDEEAMEDASDICGMVSQTCTMLYARNKRHKWKCFQNCNCKKSTFVRQMHEVCRSLGDCGGYVNIESVFTDGGYSVSRSPRLPGDLINSYISKAIAVPGVFARPDNYSIGGGGVLMNVLHGLSLREAKEKGKNWKTDDAQNTGGMLWGAMSYTSYTRMGMNKGLAKLLDPIGYYLFKGIKKRKVTFTCAPWTPPAGGNDCSKCDGNPLKPCSAYRCHSLGASCKILNEGSGKEICLDDDPNDKTAPVLKPNKNWTSDNESYGDVGDDGFSIVSSSGGCLSAYTPLTFNVETDEPAWCKFDIEMVPFENMSYDLGSNLYVWNHTTTFSLPDLSHGESQGLNWSSDFTFFIKCMDSHGIKNVDYYHVNMCLFEGDDVTPPVIRATEPRNNSFVSFDSDVANMSIITNEFSTCKWDFKDKSYGGMDFDMVCEDEFGSPSSSLGYTCRAVVPVNNLSNNFYVKCADQPWLNKTKDRNANAESFIFSLRKPAFKILIDRIKPDGDFEIGTAMKTIDLKVATLGGGDVHTCSYSFSGYDKMIEMFETGGLSHLQVLNRPSGRNKIYIECKDETGDFARNVSEFNIIRDGSSPSVSRIWQEGGYINLILNEEGECRFSLDGCKFIWDEGNYIGKGVNIRFEIDRGDRYFIRCMDEFENAPSGCSVIARAL